MPTDKRLEWHELYKAALAEDDDKKLASKVRDAEQAIVARLIELSASDEDLVERQAIHEAIGHLRALQMDRLG